MVPAQKTIRGSTQEFVEIEDIKDDLVILKNGTCCLILQVSAINFGLLSEEEQEAIIASYASLLNSLSFSLQIMIISKRKDISSYLDGLKRAEDKTTEGKIREQIRKYRDFIEQTVRKSNILDKNFYLIIPFSALELGPQGAAKVLTKKAGHSFPKEYIVERAKTALLPKREYLIRLLSRLGLKTYQLDTQSLIKLFYELYNPDVLGERLASPDDYQKPFVESSFEAGI